MNFPLTSINEVRARLISATGTQDNEYVIAMEEWIPEAMSLMRTKFTLISMWKDVKISFHKGQLPCDLRIIKAVEWNGFRFREGNSVRSVDAPPMPYEAINAGMRGTTNGFETIPWIVETPPKDNPQENSHYFWNDLVSTNKCNSLELHGEHWYQQEGFYITTSLKEGTIRVHYRAIPVDADGFPLIPDNGHYKKAIEYYVIGCMIGRGFKHPALSYQEIMNPGGLWDVFSAKAMGEIRYPTVASREYVHNNLTRLIKDESYFDAFFSTPHEETKYGFREYLYNVSPGGGRTYLTNPPNAPSQ
jgi:hypothetical protein